MILPDGNGTPISSSRSGRLSTLPVTQPVIGPVRRSKFPCAFPRRARAARGPPDDITTSTITIANANYNNATITRLTVNLTLDHQRDGDLFIQLTAPNGSDDRALRQARRQRRELRQHDVFGHGHLSIDWPATAPYSNPNGYQPLQPLANLNGSQVNGTYTLTDRRLHAQQHRRADELVDHGQLGDARRSALQTGAAMDQNADGTSDENPLTTPFTGLTPGDVYAVPTPQPTHAGHVLGHFQHHGTTASFSPPFNQNTLPLIVPGPQVASTSVPAGSGSDNLITNGTTSTLNVTFDRPMQVSTFTPSQVLADHGPDRLDLGPQYFPREQRRPDDPRRDSDRRPARSTRR